MCAVRVRVFVVFFRPFLCSFSVSRFFSLALPSVRTSLSTSPPLPPSSSLLRCSVRFLCLTAKFSSIDVRRNAVWFYLRRSNTVPVIRVRKSRTCPIQKVNDVVQLFPTARLFVCGHSFWSSRPEDC